MCNTVNMPKKLTAENGAKGLLSGEFKETIEEQCPCFDAEGNPAEGCAICDGTGATERHIYVSWTTIKEIYAMAVKNLST